MAKLNTFCIPLVSTLIHAASLASAANAQNPKHHATPSILTEFPAIAPGNSMKVLVTFSIDPKWHLYWDGLNDTGQPPRFTWTLPKGWTISEPQFPVPHRNLQPGDIVDYIYEESLTLGFTLDVPKDSAAGPGAISASIEWLECSNSCAFGSGQVQANVSVLEGSSIPAKPNLQAAQALIAFRSQLPKPWKDAKDAKLEINLQNAVFKVPNAVRLEYLPSKSSSPPKNQVDGTITDGPILTVEFATNAAPKVDGIIAVYRTKWAPPDYYLVSSGPSPIKVTEPATMPIKKGE